MQKLRSKTKTFYTALCFTLIALFAAPALATTTNDALIVLSSTDEAPILSQLPFDTIPAADLDRLADSKSDHLLRKAVASSAGVFADFSKLTAEQVESNPIFDAALREGTPIVVAQPGDGTAMAKLTGIGLKQTADQEVVVVQAVDKNEFILSLSTTAEATPGTTALIRSRLADEKGMQSVKDHDPVLSESAPLLETAVATLNDHEYLEEKALALSTAAMSQSLSATASPQAKNSVDNTGSNTPCDYRICEKWTIFLQRRISIVGEGSLDQEPMINVKFDVWLHDLQDDGVKMIDIKSFGVFNTNAITGTMVKDNEQDRGFFQDFLKLDSKVTNSSSYYLTRRHAEPTNVPDQGSESVSDTYGVSVTGNYGLDPSTAFEVNYSRSHRYTTDVIDFDHEMRTYSNTYGGSTIKGNGWDWPMNYTTGGSYNDWTDLMHNGLCHDDRLYGVGTIAKNNMTPLIYQRWEINRNYQGNLDLQFEAIQDLNHVKRTENKPCQDVYTNYYLTNSALTGWVLDLGTVHVPHG